ncbi:MAG: hypothetical protein ACYTDU_16495 [Planctomycetota bacterium]|jgi:hypothetical protein
MSHRRLLFAMLGAVVCLMVPGCGNSVRDRMIGTWTLDLEATKGLPYFQAMPEKQREALGGMTLEVTFTQNTMSKQSSVQVLEGLDKMQQSVSGTYIVNQSKGNSLVLAVTTSEGMKRVRVELRGDNQLILEMDESKTVLKRK